MKRHLAILALVVLQTSAFAQGTVQYQNGFVQRIFIFDFATGTTNPVTPATLGSQDGLGDTTGVLDVGLVWGTSAGSVNQLAAIANIGPVAGSPSGIYPGEIGGNYSLPIPGTNPGDEDWFQIFAWDSSFGNSLAGMNACLAAGGYFAAATGTPGVYGSIGAPLQFDLGPPPPGPGTLIFDPLPGFFHGFTLNSSPEPGKITICLLGALVLFWMRRGKCRHSYR